MRGKNRSAATTNSARGMAKATIMFLLVIRGEAWRVSLKDLKSMNLLIAVYTNKKNKEAGNELE